MATPSHPNQVIDGTNSLFFWDAHDVKGLHGFSEQVLVLETRDGHVPVGQETVFAVVLQA